MTFGVSETKLELITNVAQSQEDLTSKISGVSHNVVSTVPAKKETFFNDMLAQFILQTLVRSKVRFNSSETPEHRAYIGHLLIKYIVLPREKCLSFAAEYCRVINDYQNTLAPYISGASIQLQRLDYFEDWIKEIHQKKLIAMPFIISQMLQGSIYAVNIYDSVYQGRSDLVIDWGRALGEFRSIFIERGLGEDGRAIFSAERWLSSEKAVNVLQSHAHGEVPLCSLVEILGITNPFMEC